MNGFTPVIGLEIHAELTTESKLFCRCPNTSSELQTPPNTAVCPVCLGLPGALPVLNQRAVAATMALGQSLGSVIPQSTKWDRKNYFYPDLPKGYQISQYDEPLCQGGEVAWFDATGSEHRIALTRVHLEEDTGKLTHPAGADYSLIDYNRSSIPLLELVTEPVIESAEEAKQFAEEYQLRLRELGIAEASMEKGQMRCEANVSVIPHEWASDPSQRLSGTKVEIKNLNSFRSLERAIRYEIERQSRALAAGETLRQETRGWNEVKGQTYVMRTKETAEDYRYFPEPDLGRLELVTLKTEPQPSVSRFERFQDLVAEGVKPNEIHVVLSDLSRSRFLASLIAAGLPATAYRVAVLWLGQEPALLVHEPEQVATVLTQLAENAIRPAVLKEALAHAQPGELSAKVEQLQSGQSVDNLTGIVSAVLQAHPAEVSAYKAGKTQLFGYFVGQVRKSLEGKGDPVAIAEAIKQQLDGGAS